MSDIIVEGLSRLEGSVNIQGSKNAVLPIIAATVLSNGRSYINNCPYLSDVLASIKILECLGAECKFEGNTLTVDSTNIDNYCVPDNLMREMRSSSLFLGAIIGRTGKAVICNPGGCELGPRPIDLHIKALKSLGATVNEYNGCIEFSSDNGLKGNEIQLSFPSVGATENIILASVTAKGRTVVRNCAREPEIVDLARYLNLCGAKIKGAGKDTVIVEGVKQLNGADYFVMPDRIVASTYISAAAITGGKINIKNIYPDNLNSIISVYKEAGCNFEINGNSLVVDAPNRLNAVSTVRSLVYPGFPTDSGPMLIASLTKSKGSTIFVENIFENRFRYVDELKRMGADISVEGKVAVVDGINETYGANCEATDLRGGAALVVAALGAKGKTKITKIEHIKRGYEDIVRDLSYLGADIKEV